jgi:thiamine-monophosphate kinase
VGETEFIAALRSLARDPAARGLLDDAAVLGDLVFTHDMIVEGVHFLADDPPEDVAWKLAAVNLSDLAAKGAEPVGCLLGYTLGPAEWNEGFIAGLRAVLDRYAMPLLGGDTVKGNGPRSFGLTAIGRSARAPAREGARAGDALYVTGVIGRAGVGLELLKARRAGSEIEAYRRPQPRLAEGRALAPIVHAMMDVSDGLLIDASRMAAASGLAVEIDLDMVPVSGDPMRAVTAGDDYELLFAAPSDLNLAVAATRIGGFAAGEGFSLTRGGHAIPLPSSLGWVHG